MTNEFPLTRHVRVFGRVFENGVNCTRVPALTCTNCGRAKEKWKTRWGDKRGRRIARAENGDQPRERGGGEVERKLEREKGVVSRCQLAHKSYSSSVWCLLLLLVRERVPSAGKHMRAYVLSARLVSAQISRINRPTNVSSGSHGKLQE